MLDIVEPQLKKLSSVFFYDYPASQAALARVAGNKAKRFELYLEGIELCNAFDELWDKEQNQQRFEQVKIKRQKEGYEIPPEDKYFFEALSKSLPPCSGNALGFDRLVAILAGGSSIDSSINFRDQWKYEKV